MESANFGFNEIPPKIFIYKNCQELVWWGFWLLRIDIFNTITRGSLRVSYRLRYVSVQCPDSFEWCDFILLMTFYIFSEVSSIIDQMRIPSAQDFN